MAALVFRLRHVPDDEVSDVTALLDEAGIDWFETDAGNWGISMPALWVRRDADRDRARELIERYQGARAERLRAERARRRADGLEPTLGARLRERPLASLGALAFCAFVLYVSIEPFVRLVALART